MASQMLEIVIYLVLQACVSCINGQEVGNRISLQNIRPLREMGGTAALHNSATDLQSKTHFCGAILISDRWLLTAGHCIVGDLRSYRISLGREDLNADTQPGDNTYQVQEHHVHPDYGSATHDYNDMALLKTDRVVSFSQNIWPFCMPERNQDFVSFLPVQIAGWGHENRKKKSSRIQTTYVNLMGKPACESKWRKFAPNIFNTILTEDYPQGLSDKILCAGREGVDQCRGDSGGPMVYKNAEGLQTVIGIISKGIRSCPPYPVLPSFYTNVAYFMDWIYTTTRLPSSSKNINCGEPPSSRPEIITTPRSVSRTTQRSPFITQPTPRPEIITTPRPVSRTTQRPPTINANPPRPRPSPGTSGCSDGFLSYTGSSQCFKIFKSVERSWDEAKKKCEAEGLVQAKPSAAVAVALRKDLNNRYGGGNGVWLAARGDGSKIVWKADRTELSKNSLLWFPWEPANIQETHCLVMLLWDNDIKNHPGRPYACHVCTQPYLTLCEEDQR